MAITRGTHVGITRTDGTYIDGVVRYDRRTAGGSLKIWQAGVTRWIRAADVADVEVL